MIDKKSLKTYPFSYPILITNSLIEDNIYTQLKYNWPDFKKFKTRSAGQVSRLNIEIKKNNNNYKKINPFFKQLYNELNSKKFRDFLKTKFDFEKAKKEEGYIGNFDTSELVMHIAESTDGYENPWHVDTRGRIIHFLIYFGDETILEGGNIAIAEHKKLNNYLEYKQYPNLNNLTNIEYIEPKNNVGLFILSQNNSYHKGCSIKGLRKFIYAGYTNKNGNAWKTKNWSMKQNFVQRLKKEYI